MTEFERVLCDTAQAGQLKQPVESRYGFHIVRIDHFEPGKLLEFDMVQRQVEMYLQDTIHRTSVSQFIMNLANAADLKGIELSVGGCPYIE